MTSPSSRFVAALAAYPRGALGPHELCTACVDVLPVDRAAVAISVAATGWEPLSASDEVAANIEAQQSITGEGPAVDATRRGRPVLVDDLSARLDQWPGLRAALGTDARGAMFAFPLRIGVIAIGALDLYRVEPISLATEEAAAIFEVAGAVTTVLLSGAPFGGHVAGDLDPWWAPSVASNEIHQATGMVVAQLEVPPAVAYLRLRAHAFANDRSLATVARDVIDRRLRFHPDGTR